MCHSDDLDNFSDRWIERFQDLKRFVLKHGHCHVPIKLEENPALSKWAKRQRYQWKLKQGGKHSTLTDARQVLLEDMGFLWDVRLSVWDQRFRELLLFRRSNGHCNVPLTCQRFSKLGTWVKCQRRQYRLLAMGRKSNMTPARIRQLNDLGFAWKGRDGSSALCGTEGDDAASSMSTKKTTE
jgi:Helicase associated domain